MLARGCCLLLGVVIVSTAGCMCSSCDDYCYTGSGGTWERLDQCFGRVGSAFTPEVGAYADEVGMETMEASDGSPIESLPAGEPTPADDPAPAPPDDKEPLPAETSVLQNRDIISR